MAEVDLEESAQRFTRVGPTHPVGTERQEGATGQEARHLLGNDLHEVGDGDDRPGGVGQQAGDIGNARRLAGMEPVPPFDLEGVLAQALVRGRRPQLDTDVEVLRQFGRCLPRCAVSRPGEEQGGPTRRTIRRRRPPVEAAHDRGADLRRVTLGQRGHRVVLVVEGDVIENVGVVTAAAIHAMQPLLHDRGHLVGKGRVVRLARRHGRGMHQRVTVLVLQPFAHQRRAAGGGAQQEPACARIGRLPDEVADALEAEHRIERVERHHRHATSGVGRAGGDEAGRRAGLGDPFLEDLAVGCLCVAEQHLVVDGFVLLTL